MRLQQKQRFHDVALLCSAQEHIDNLNEYVSQRLYELCCHHNTSYYA